MNVVSATGSSGHMPPSNDMAENITPAGRKQSNPMQDERQAMDKYQGYIAQIREEQAMRMENLKKYFPFFQIADNSLEQFQNGKYAGSTWAIRLWRSFACL